MKYPSAPPSLIIGLSLFILLGASSRSYGQDRTTVGIFIRPGVSYGISPSNSQVNQQVQTYTYYSIGTGFYSFIPLSKSDSARRILKHIKIEYATLSIRSGAFDLGNGNIARITGQSTDISAVLPVGFSIAHEVQAYSAIGFNAGYTFKTMITPSSASPGTELGSSFKAGLVAELGFKFGQGSLVGLRSLYEFSGKYPYEETSFMIAFSPMRAKKKSNR